MTILLMPGKWYNHIVGFNEMVKDRFDQFVEVNNMIVIGNFLYQATELL